MIYIGLFTLLALASIEATDMYYPYSSSDVNYPTYYSSYWGGYVPYGNGYSKRDATDMYYPYSSSDVNYPTYYSSYWGGYVPYGNGYSK